MMSVGTRARVAAIACAALLCATGPASGQFDTSKRAGVSWGLRGAGLKPLTELTDRVGLSGSTFLRFGLMPRWELELGGGFGEYKGSAYEGLVGTAEARLMFALNTFGAVNPFVYAGGGMMHYEVSKLPPQAVPGYRNEGWTPTVPAGGGFRIRVTENLAIEGTVDFTYTYRDDINGAPIEKGNDVLWRVGGGITVGHFGAAPRTRMPERIEVPEPPVPAPQPPPEPPESLDRDNDGLTDEEETGRYGTNPLEPDTDSDGLRDGAEVTHYGTDPNRADTDGGTVDDRVEVRRGSDPLDPSDDVPEPEPPATAQPRTIRFDAGVFWETPQMRAEVDALADWLLGHPTRKVLLRGHSDSSGRADYNLWLSRQRARAVRDYLVEKGVDRGRIATEGAGDREPVASNATAEGRRQNRRVEIRLSE